MTHALGISLNYKKLCNFLGHLNGVKAYSMAWMAGVFKTEFSINWMPKKSWLLSTIIIKTKTNSILIASNWELIRHQK